MLHIVTVATDNLYYLPYLRQTCADMGAKLIVLGMGEKWGGYVWKITKMIDFLKTVSPTDIVCFVDGYDVICTRSLSYLVPTFLEIINREKCKIIIAKDSIALPSIIRKLYFGYCKNTSINSGTYIGFAYDILDTLIRAQSLYPTETDDQKLLTSYCNHNPGDFYIDIHSEIFYVASTIPLQTAIIPQNIHPFFVHAPACGYLDDVLQNMGYVADPSIKRQLRSYVIRKTLEHTRHACKQYYIIWIMVIFIGIYITLT